jgi:hypothetical protein
VTCDTGNQKHVTCDEQKETQPSTSRVIQKSKNCLVTYIFTSPEFGRASQGLHPGMAEPRSASMRVKSEARGSSFQKMSIRGMEIAPRDEAASGPYGQFDEAVFIADKKSLSDFNMGPTMMDLSDHGHVPGQGGWLSGRSCGHAVMRSMWYRKFEHYFLPHRRLPFGHGDDRCWSSLAPELLCTSRMGTRSSAALDLWGCHSLVRLFVLLQSRKPIHLDAVIQSI